MPEEDTNTSKRRERNPAAKPKKEDEKGQKKAQKSHEKKQDVRGVTNGSKIATES